MQLICMKITTNVSLDLWMKKKKKVLEGFGNFYVGEWRKYRKCETVYTFFAIFVLLEKKKKKNDLLWSSFFLPGNFKHKVKTHFKFIADFRRDFLA